MWPVATANVGGFEKFDLVFGVPSSENDDCGCDCECDYDCGCDYDFDSGYGAAIGFAAPMNTTRFV